MFFCPPPFLGGKRPDFSSFLGTFAYRQWTELDLKGFWRKIHHVLNLAAPTAKMGFLTTFTASSLDHTLLKLEMNVQQVIAITCKYPNVFG